MTGPLASVVIPAHDEAAVIDRCLDALLAGAAPGELEVVVAANACTDDTADRARVRPGVAVVELTEAGKIGALNAGDAVVSTFPRIYLDADAVLTTADARALAARLSRGDVLAAAPHVALVTDGVSSLVAWHYRAWAALPVTGEGYVGSGVYAVSREGHTRVAPFPDVIADDDYVRRSFAPAERASSDGTYEVRPPRTVRAYVARALRGRTGNVQLAASGIELAPQPGASGVRALLPLLRKPRTWPWVASFVALTTLVRLRLALAGGAVTGWNHDRSSRVAQGSSR